MRELDSEEQEIMDYARKREIYFGRFALRHLRWMRILKKGRILGKENREWRNVAEHCLAEAVLADVLAEILGASREKVVRAALIHDWYKRMEVEAMRSKGGGQGYLETAGKDEALLAEYGVEEEIIQLAHSNILPNDDPDYVTNRSLEQKIMHFVDMVMGGSEIVSYEERIRIVSQKPHNVEFSDSFRGQYRGRGLFEVQADILRAEEEEFAARMGIEPQELLPKLRELMEERCTQGSI